MLRESRKIHLIEEVLRINDEPTLSALEGVLKKAKDSETNKMSIYDFVGLLSEKETKQVKKAIAESCEIVHTQDWK
jgi:hypothetical protein